MYQSIERDFVMSHVFLHRVCGLQPAVHFFRRLQRPSSHLFDFQWVTLNCNMLANSFKSVASFRRALSKLILPHLFGSLYNPRHIPFFLSQK